MLKDDSDQTLVIEIPNKSWAIKDKSLNWYIFSFHIEEHHNFDK